jgi:hypothetical protein
MYRHQPTLSWIPPRPSNLAVGAKRFCATNEQDIRPDPLLHVHANSRPKPTKRSPTKLPQQTALPPPRPELAKVLGFLGICGPWVGVLLVALKWFGPIALTASQVSDLTRGGHFWVKMERDIPLYVWAISACVASFFVVPWHRMQIARAPVRSVALAAGGLLLAMLPAVFWGDMTPLAGTAQSGFLEMSAWVISAASYSFVSFRSLYTAAPPTRLAPLAGFQDLGSLPPVTWRDGMILIGLAFLLFIPDPHLLAGRFFQIEDFTHWNGFLMTWALAFKHGAAMYLDVIPIYGGAWPALFGWVAQFRGLNYADCISFCIVFSILYYFVFYYLLRYITGTRLVSVSMCLLAVVGLTFLSGEPESKSIVWRWPSTTPMRAPVDIFFFLALLVFCRTPKLSTAALIGLSVGLGPLFAIDTGVFLCSTFGATWLLILLVPGGTQYFRCFGVSSLALVLTLLSGFLLITRWKLFEPETLHNFFEFKNRVSSGLGLIPIAELAGCWVGLFSLSLLVLLGTTVFGVSRERARLSLPDSISWAAGIYGLQRVIYFMGRTTAGTLQVAILPVVLCVAILLAPLLRRRRLPDSPGVATLPPVGSVSPLEWAASGVCVFASFLLLLISKDVPNYPALWSLGIQRPEGWEGSLSSGRRNVGGLPAEYKDYVSAFGQMCEKMREFHQKGLRVQVLDACSTTMYALADVPPFGKDANEFDRADTSWEEIERLRKKIGSEGADVIFINRLQGPWPRVFCQEALRACREEIGLYYNLGETNVYFEVWKRKSPRR